MVLFVNTAEFSEHCVLRLKVLLNFSEKMMSVLTDSLRHVYQRCSLEDYADILQNVYKVI